MRVLIFHGYLLRGTGSNIYNASLSAALLRLGHEVHLLCQERHADELEFVGAVGDWDTGELRVRRVREAGCTVYRPDIGRLLPVYVADQYEGLDARPFPELSEAELASYLERNVDAVREVVSRVEPDVALANHLVMGPAILARALTRAGVPYAVKIHGSALEYTVKPHPRFLPYAREGLAAASAVLVGSRHTAESLWGAVDEPWLPAHTRLAPPGVDVTVFRPVQRPRSQQIAFVGRLIAEKGIDLLLDAWPQVLEQVADARLVIAGSGPRRESAEERLEALGVRDSVTFTGLLDHRALAELLPECEAVVVPSTFPEAFGMVAVEAAACGALPIVAAHSGLVEVSRTLAAQLPEQVRELVSFVLSPTAAESIADRVLAWLNTPSELRETARAALVQTAAERYSWERVAEGVLAAARGELDRLQSIG